VSLVHYDGDLSHCALLSSQQFDLIFSKSVLVLLGDALPRFLQELNNVLDPGGRVIFIENANGGKTFAFVRWLRSTWWKHTKFHYFDAAQLEQISVVFQVDEVKKSFFPPIYLVMGRKKPRHD
jgi:SAM-dependent methyltransferase